MVNRLPNSNQWISIITILYYYWFSFSKAKRVGARCWKPRTISQHFHYNDIECKTERLSLIIIFSDLWWFWDFWNQWGFTCSFISLWLLCSLKVHFLLSKRFIVFALNFDHTQHTKPNVQSRNLLKCFPMGCPLFRRCLNQTNCVVEKYLIKITKLTIHDIIFLLY